METQGRRSSLAFVLALSLVGLVAPSPGAYAQGAQALIARHEPATQRLVTIVEHDARLKELLAKSIAAAKRMNPDRRTNPAQSLDEYYAFIDWAAKALPWSILPDLPYPKLYEKIDQSLDYFYFVNDQVMDELRGAPLYNASIQYLEPYRSWLIDFTRDWGLFLSEPGSWNAKYYRMAYEDERFGLQKGWYEDPSNWHSFNQFFARRLAPPSAKYPKGPRPIESPGDASVLVAPADSKPQGVWRIDNVSNIVGAGGAGTTIKSGSFASAAALIGEDSEYAYAFAGGTLTHTFLDVNDYHRYHFPVGGIVKEVRLIPADDAAGGVTTWSYRDGSWKYILDAARPGWQSVETRACVILETKDYGLVAILPIGMSQVSSVNFEDYVKPGKVVAKGDMLGYFLFGGSDIVMIFQSCVDFRLTAAPDPKEPGAYAHLLMGEKYGEIKPRE
jgi:phosphatidylserine decarboxylase